VNLFRGATPVSTRTGNGSITDAAAVADGTLSYTATQTDLAGNTGAASTALSVVLDTAAPAAPTAPDRPPGSDSGATNTDNITTGTSGIFDLAGSGSSALVNLLRGATSVASRSGAGSITDSAAVADGTLSYTATQTDVAGNLSAASPALSVTLDTTAPGQPSAPVLLNPVAAATTTSSSPRFSTGVSGNAVVLLRNGSPVATSLAGGD